MDIIIILSDEEVEALTKDFTPIDVFSIKSKSIDFNIEFINRVKSQVINPSILRQKTYSQSVRNNALQIASKEDIAQIDSILEKYK